MRILAIAATLAILALVAPTATAVPADCTSEPIDAGLVRATVYYGTECADVDAQRCTLETNPEYPSHPYWRCTRII